MTDIITENQGETFFNGEKLAGNLEGGEVIALYGELGSGKTTFTSGVVNYFIKGKRVLSPTFIIVRHYFPKSNKIEHLLHIDLYRLKNLKDIEDLGLTEFMNKAKTVVLIEWADKMKHLLPGERIDISFKEIAGNKRKITYG